MLKMILAGGVFAILLGSVIGMVAGYKGGRIDVVLMSITDTLMAMPGLPLIIVLAFLITPENPYVIGILISINAWTGLARSIRSQMLPLRDIEYVEANRMMGIPTRTILARDIVPNLAPYIAVNFVLASRRIIFASVALYFLGVLGTNKPNWGVMINLAYSSGGALYSWSAAHWLLVPMFAVVFFSLGFIFLSQAADRLFNPRIRARHQKTTADEEAPDA
jgi:peptide/nickel transport system permease protein